MFFVSGLFQDFLFDFVIFAAILIMPGVDFLVFVLLVFSDLGSVVWYLSLILENSQLF